jgi:hypothetical protein
MTIQSVLILMLVAGSVLVLTRKFWAKKKPGKKGCGGCCGCG